MPICKNCGVDHELEPRASVRVVLEQHPIFEALRISVTGNVPYPENVDRNNREQMDAFNKAFVSDVQKLIEERFDLGPAATHTVEKHDREADEMLAHERGQPPSMHDLLNALLGGKIEVVDVEDVPPLPAPKNLH